MIDVRTILLALAVAALAGCQTTPTKLKLPSPLTVDAHAENGAAVEIAHATPQRTRTNVEPTPKPPVSPLAASGLGIAQSLPPFGPQPVSANLNNLPLPAFINTVYGQLLHVDYVMDPALAKSTDLVTLSVNDPQPPATFYKIAGDVLRRYGITAQWDGHTVNLVPSAKAKGNEPPILVSGRALPNVPESHRPVFQLVQLHSVSTGDVEQWLKTAYGDSELKVAMDIRRNAIMLSGPRSLVQQAVKSIGVLDRPYLRGSHSTRIEPAFISAADLAPRLVDALRAEGYSASTTIAPGIAIVVLPIPAANSLLVFAPDEASLQHVVHWAKSIDRPNPTSGANSLFYYQVQNTKAADIAKVLNGVGTGQDQNLTMGSNVPPPEGAPGAAAGKPPASPHADVTGSGTLRVDEPRNALIFRGDPAEWERMLPLIKQMDRPARQVMIQVTIAEVTLDNDSNYGLSWLAFDQHGRFHGSWAIGQLAGAGAGGAGLSYLVDVAGVNRAQLTALASDKRVTILSTPRVLVKSGEEASIDVGNEVPTLTAQTTSQQQTEGNTNLLQSIQYRKTGIILDVKPTIYSDNRIDLDISQEVSQAQPVDASSGVNSPAIFSRKVQTSLTLKDGGSVVLGGLVSKQETQGNSGVPFLKDIPLLGHLFRTDTNQKQRTELLIIIVPYIIDSDRQAEAVTNAVVDSMHFIDTSALKKATGTPLKLPSGQQFDGAGNATGNGATQHPGQP